MLTRRSLLALLASTSAAGAVNWPESYRRRILTYLEQHRRAEGAYGWSSDVMAQLTPTFGTVGCYRILGAKVPDSARVASFVRDNYPAQEPRRIDRPMWRLDFEQVQSLLWLDESIESFRQPASTWTAPSVLTPRYELHKQPVLQNQAMAVHIRYLLKLSPSAEDKAWRDYFQERLRPDGTFNNTPASDGSGGHVMNTRWGLLAAEHLGLTLPPAPGLAEWVRACQTATGGFTWAPHPALGAVDDLAYTWCALQTLQQLNAKPARPAQCAQWIESLQTSEGGFQDRPGGEPNPLATFYALSCLQLLDHEPGKAVVKAAPRARRVAIPTDHNVYSIQIEAPGNGSPREAVLLAKTLGIHIWAAKNAPAGWTAEAQRIAGEDKAPVTFAVGDEEYGTYYGVAGLGCYSHLVDIHAPAGADFGKAMEKKNHPYTYEEFRDQRIHALHRGKGRLIWQCNDNEEITRVLLDEAEKTGSYAAIASFHFGKQDFAHTYPFLHRWYGRIPFVGLLDAHTAESWWWGDQLAGQKTLYLAKEPTWDGWLEALRNNWVMSVRHDAVTGWKTHITGGQPHVREFAQRRAQQWTWWDKDGQQSRRPAASMVLLRPGMRFEAGAPVDGSDPALRIRLWQNNTQMGGPAAPRTELVSLQVDGAAVTVPEPRVTKADRYYLVPVGRQLPGEHRAEAQVRLLDTGKLTACSVSWMG
jgi:hypothetical protein